MGLREQYRACINLADASDSKLEDEMLRKDAAEILLALRKECTHVHTVCTRMAYRNCYSADDYPEDEQRTCLICGISESEEIFKILTTIPFTRIDSRKLPEEVKNPLNFLLSEILELVEVIGMRYFVS